MKYSYLETRCHLVNKSFIILLTEVDNKSLAYYDIELITTVKSIVIQDPI